jgi:hypothetical protein
MFYFLAYNLISFACAKKGFALKNLPLSKDHGKTQVHGYETIPPV